MTAVLDGIRILDLTEWLAGSLGTRILGDMGADVIKIEPLAGDPSRDLEAVRQRTKRRLPSAPWNYYYECNNRNKRGIALDLASAEGKAIMAKLVACADVFATTYDDATLLELGLDAASLAGINPKIIYARLSGWGRSGPAAGTPALDALTEARAGNMTRIGEPGQPPIYTCTGQPTAGIDLAYAIQMALFHRLRTGEAQEVDVSLHGANIFFESFNLEMYAGSGGPASLAGQLSRRNVGNPLFNIYPTKDKWVYMCMMQTDRWWPNLVRAMHREDLATDPRFESHAKICGESRQDAIDILDEVLPTQSADYWFGDEVRKEIELILTPVASYEDLIDDPQAKDNEYILDYEHPEYGPIKVLGFPGQFVATPASIRMPAPKLGEHTAKILGELGYSDEEVARLRSKRAIA